MIDLGVALTWAAISVASIKGLTVLARAGASSENDGEPLVATSDASLTLRSLRSIGAPPRRRTPTKILAASTDAPSRARARL